MSSSRGRIPLYVVLLATAVIAGLLWGQARSPSSRDSIGVTPAPLREPQPAAAGLAGRGLNPGGGSPEPLPALPVSNAPRGLGFTWLRVVSQSAPLPGVVAREVTAWETVGAQIGHETDAEGLLISPRRPVTGTRVHLHLPGYEATIFLYRASDGVPEVELQPVSAPTRVYVDGHAEASVAGLVVTVFSTDGQQVRARETKDHAYEVLLSPTRIRQLLIFDPKGRYAEADPKLGPRDESGSYRVSVEQSRGWRILVTDAATGKPIPSAIARGPFLAESETGADDDGIITWRHWTHQQTGGMMIIAPGYRRKWCTAGEGGPKLLIQVKLAKGPWVRGVLTLNGKPLAGATVMGDRSGFPPEFSVTLEDGAYEIRALEAHARALRVKHAQLGVQLVDLPKTGPPGGGPVEMDIALRTSIISVSVVHRGTPVSNAIVVCGPFESKADASGKAELRGVFKGLRVVWASHEGKRGAAKLPSEGVAEIELGEVGGVSGTVTPPPEPRTLILLEALAADGEVLTVEFSRTTKMGHFHFEKAIRGYAYRVRVAGSDPVMSREPVYVGETVEIIRE